MLLNFTTMPMWLEGLIGSYLPRTHELSRNHCLEGKELSAGVYYLQTDSGLLLPEPPDGQYEPIVVTRAGMYWEIPCELWNAIQKDSHYMAHPEAVLCIPGHFGRYEPRTLLPVPALPVTHRVLEFWYEIDHQLITGLQAMEDCVVY